MARLFTNENDEKKSWLELQQFLTSRMEEAENGEISNRSVTEITNTVLGEER